jgi:hypothetical protein
MPEELLYFAYAYYWFGGLILFVLLSTCLRIVSSFPDAVSSRASTSMGAIADTSLPGRIQDKGLPPLYNNSASTQILSACHLWDFC